MVDDAETLVTKLLVVCKPVIAPVEPFTLVTGAVYVIAPVEPLKLVTAVELVRKPELFVRSDVCVGTVMFAVTSVDAFAVNVPTDVPFF